jgi:predicted alpha/beta hydrolase family esterase
MEAKILADKNRLQEIYDLTVTAYDVLFIQGGGNDGYETDAQLVASLRKALGNVYKVHYPKIISDERVKDLGSQWQKQIGKEISSLKGEVILAGHSLGASMLLKYVSENKIKKNIAGIFLIAPPFWSGNEDWVQSLKLQKDFSGNLPKDLPIFFYQCKDDEVVPFEHLKFYKQNLPRAVFREIESGGHQFNNDLTLVADDIKSLGKTTRAMDNKEPLT